MKHMRNNPLFYNPWGFLLVDFNVISTRLELFHAYKLDNHVYFTFIFNIFVSLFLMKFFSFFSGLIKYK